ncbi:MAG: hypothetical protein HAW58_00475 [Candidatus Thioglobus sp.]|nr:hypothetical protein [Candidatus Thioglobus sp.]
MKNSNKLSKLFALSILTLTLSSCGGSAGGGGASEQGRFKDANVDGLSYTGSFPGITEGGGKFNYQTGDVLAFSVGDIELGTATAAGIITLNDLSGKNANQVSKVAQLLQSLDADSDLPNGITINAAARAALTKGTTEVDTIITVLAATTPDFLGDLANLVTLVSAADSAGTYTQVSKTNADAHLLETLSCAYSGGFVGTQTAADASTKVAFLINSDGTVKMVNAAGTTDTGTVNISLAGKPSWTHDSITYTLETINSLSGVGADKQITAERIGGELDAIYRFTAISANYGIFTFDVAGTNTAVTGTAYNLENDESFPITGDLSDTGALDARIEDGLNTALSASFVLTAGMVGINGVGVWSILDGSSGIFTGSGCKLN